MELNDTEELEKMFALLKDEIKDAVYLPAYEQLGAKNRIRLWISVPNFAFGNIQLWSDDTLDINDNYFRLSDGAAERIYSAFISNEKTEVTLYEEITDTDTADDAKDDTEVYEPPDEEETAPEI